MPNGKRLDIRIPPGVDKDNVSYTAMQYTDANNIRFYKGYPQTIGGTATVYDPSPATMGDTPYLFNGVIRSLYSFIDENGTQITMIGSNAALYAKEDDVITNITPLTGSTSAVTSLGTNYLTLGSNPISVTLGSPVVTLNVSTLMIASFRIGDNIKVSGVTTTIGGIVDTSFNGTFMVAGVNTVTNTITYINSTETDATSTAVGGGASVILATSLVNVNLGSITGYTVGELIAISGATLFGGYSAVSLNIQSAIRGINTGSNYLQYYAPGDVATSSATGGGEDILIQSQIAGGACDFVGSYGYGLGYYGLGVYGIGYASVTGAVVLPQIYSFDRYGLDILLTPGSQKPVYTWNTDPTVSPTIISNSPTYVNYVFVANDQCIVFGPTSGGDNSAQNVFQTSVVGDYSTWTGIGAQTYVLANCGLLIAHAVLKDQVLLFTQNNVKRMIWSNVQLQWIIEDLFSSDGLIGPKAVISFNNVVVWVGNVNMYIYNGAVVTTIPRNTLRQWFYNTLNLEESYKVFLRQNIVFDEIWVHFPSQNSVECDTVMIWSFAPDDFHFTNGTADYTACENPTDVNRPQYMANGSCVMPDLGDPSMLIQASYMYEVELTSDYSDNGEPVVGSLTTNDSLLQGGDAMVSIERIVPSNTLLPINQTPSEPELLYTITVSTKEYDGQTIPRTFGPYSVYTNTDKIEARANGRQWNIQYDFNTTVGFRIEKFFAEIKPISQR